MTRVKGRTVLAGFDTSEPAFRAARRIKERDLGEVRVDRLTGPGEDTPFGGNLLGLAVGPDGLGLGSSGDSGPLTRIPADLVQESLDRPSALLRHRPRLGSVLLTVVTEEADVPAVVAVIRDAGGRV